GHRARKRIAPADLSRGDGSHVARTVSRHGNGRITPRRTNHERVARERRLTYPREKTRHHVHASASDSGTMRWVGFRSARASKKVLPMLWVTSLLSTSVNRSRRICTGAPLGGGAPNAEITPKGSCGAGTSGRLFGSISSSSKPAVVVTIVPLV